MSKRFILFILSLLVVILSSNCTSIGKVRGRVLFQSNSFLPDSNFSFNLLAQSSVSMERANAVESNNIVDEKDKSISKSSGIESKVNIKIDDEDDEDDEDFDDDDELDGKTEHSKNKESFNIVDPFENINRGIFQFNDFMFTWFFNPMAKAFHFILPDPIRLGIRNFFLNITTVGRVVNNLLQGKIINSFKEVTRFVINSTIGVAGLFDPATHIFNITVPIEDFGQTLAVWGIGNGVYLQLPFFGPSSIRDGIGKLVDIVLDPTTYFPIFITPNIYKQTSMSITRFTVDNVNLLSFNLGQYEDFINSALDPYTLFKDIYSQYRIKQIKD